MASTYSALKIELLETGANSGTWGTATNVNLGDDILGEAITGSATVNFASDADVTITLTDSSTSQSARNLRLNITESSTGVGSVRNLILGSGCQIEKFYLIRNNGTGVKTVKNTTGTGVAVAAGKATLVYNDGTNVVDVLNSFSSAILGAENAGSIIPFYFSGSPGDPGFPSASTYHGAIVHSHAQQCMFFAHGGNWVRMLDEGTDVTVAQGGTGLSSGTSGGVLGFTASGTLASSVALTASALVLGGGAGATPTPMGSLGTTTTVLHGNAVGAPTFGAVSLAADVTGTLPVTNGGTGIATTTAYSVVFAGTTATGAFQAAAGPGTATHVLTSNGAGALPTFQAPAASGISAGKSIAFAMIFGL